MHENMGLMTPASGALPAEKKDDVPVKASEGEFVLPAEVVRFYGSKFLMKLMSDAQQGISQMREQGMIQDAPPAPAGPPPATNAQGAEALGAPQGPEAPVNEPPPVGMAEGGLVAPRTAEGGTDWSNPQFAVQLRDQYMRMIYNMHSQAAGTGAAGLATPTAAGSSTRSPVVPGNSGGIATPTSTTRPADPVPTPASSPFDPTTSMDPRFNPQLRPGGDGQDNPGNPDGSEGASPGAGNGDAGVGPGVGDSGVGSDGEAGDGGGAPFAHGGLVVPRRR